MLLRWLGKSVLALIVAALLYSAWIVYLVGQPLFGVLLLFVAMVSGVVFSSRRFYTLRFIVPGMITMILFVIFPIVYTIYLGFTNYGSFNLLHYERAQQVILSSQIVDKSSSRPFSITNSNEGYQIFIADQSGTGGFLTESVVLNKEVIASGEAISLNSHKVAEQPAQVLSRRDVIQLRKGLALISIQLPHGEVLQSAGLRTFAAIKPEYLLQSDDSIINQFSEKQYWPDHEVGFYADADGKQLAPGWRTNIGWGNFERIINSAGIRGPMWSIFLWTIGFAVGSVVFCFAVGVALAVVLQWPHLRFRSVYRVLLILPYAVPAFISILVFKGLFNQNFGE
ncbi:MAG: maltose ABC transporter permease MalF, partial [Gammaproteobacteria bacterium]|nr:maltose ABC transporter permease MalF [Gammaproteobacteria bacterium]